MPPPGAGLKTVMLTLPDAVISDAGTQATNWLLLTNEVTSDVAFHITEEVWEKFEPFMTNSKAGPPAFAETGETGEVIASIGARLLGPVMVKSTTGDEAPEVGITATLPKPGEAISAPLIWVVSFEALKNAVT